VRGQIRYVSGQPVYTLDGQEVTAEQFEQCFPSSLDLAEEGECLPAQTSSCWPMLSEGLAVHPRQIEQARARNRRHGVNVDYTPDGRAILMDRGQRRDLLRLEGYHDKHGGYGD
jgi:hypothetical protein